jgi:hypothetical protein
MLIQKREKNEKIFENFILVANILCPEVMFFRINPVRNIHPEARGYILKNILLRCF